MKQQSAFDGRFESDLYLENSPKTTSTRRDSLFVRRKEILSDSFEKKKKRKEKKILKELQVLYLGSEVFFFNIAFDYGESTV